MMPISSRAGARMDPFALAPLGRQSKCWSDDAERTHVLRNPHETGDVGA